MSMCTHPHTHTWPTGDSVNLNAPGKYREIGWRWLEISVMIERVAQRNIERCLPVNDK